MDIYLVRHGEYVDLGSATPEQDSLNPLSERGIAKLQRQARTLAEWNVPVEQIITSPFLRAKQTAEIFAEALIIPVSEHTQLTRSWFTPQALLEIVRGHSHVEHLMLVGHESDLSTTASHVIGGGHLELARGGIIRLSLDSRESLEGKLIWLLSPQVMGADS